MRLANSGFTEASARKLRCSKSLEGIELIGLPVIRRIEPQPRRLKANPMNRA